MSRPIRVLVVDDAAFMRRWIVRLLSGEPTVQVVGEAADGEEAVESFQTLRPDVICLDIDMPRMSGLTALKHIMSTAPRPIVVVSSMTDRDDIPFEALRLGAIDFFPKPSSLSGSVAEQTRHLLYLIRNAHQVRADRLRRVPITPTPCPAAPADGRSSRHGGPEAGPAGQVIVVAGSIGSVSSLIRILAELPRTGPGSPSVILRTPIHPVIAGSFRRSVTELLGWPLIDAETGGNLAAGTACFLPPGHTVQLQENRISVAEHGNGHLLDALLGGIGKCFAGRSTAILLAGDSDDGISGLQAAHEAGASCFIQDERSALFSTWEPRTNGIEAVDIEQLVMLLKRRLEAPAEGR